MRQFADLLKMTASLLSLTFAIGLLSSGKALANPVTGIYGYGGAAFGGFSRGAKVTIDNGSVDRTGFSDADLADIRDGITTGSTMVALVPNCLNDACAGYGVNFIFGTIGNLSVSDPVSDVSCPGATVDVGSYDSLDVQIPIGSSCQLSIETDGGQKFTALLGRFYSGDYYLSGGTYDSPPTVVLTSNANDPHSGVFTVTATFSEAVTGFAVGDVSVGNGTASNFQTISATVYTFDVTPTANGAVTVDIAADVAEDTATNGNTAATQLSVASDNTDPVVTISGPTEVVVDDFTVTLTFSEVVTGFVAEDIAVTNGEKGTFTEMTPGKVYTLVVTPELGKTVAVSVSADKAQDAAGNGNEASDVFEVSAGSPASEFEKNNAEIKQDIVAEVQNTLQNAVTANVRMVKDAKSRFIASTRSSLNGPAGFAGQNNVPFDVAGVANGTAMRLSTNGTFFGQVGNDEGTKRRVFFGDFSIVGEQGGSVTGSISGKVAWEQNLSDKTMYGYFIGAQVNQTDIKTTFTGKQQGYGVNIGSYVVNKVAENVYIDGFVSLGMGKSDLDMSNDVLSLDGSYETKSATIGGALTGVYDMESYEFWPELAFTAGKTQVGTAKFTGRAYGLVDNNLSLDAGDVTVANLTLRPEVRIPLEAGSQSGATSQVTFAPRAICERITTDVTTENCGRGAELGFIRRSGDGLTHITGRLSRDYVGTSTRTGLELKLEHFF